MPKWKSKIYFETLIAASKLSLDVEITYKREAKNQNSYVPKI